MAGKLEVMDDFGIEQADGIGGDGILEAGSKFFRQRRPTHHSILLEHNHGNARTCEITCRGEAIVTAA